MAVAGNIAFLPNMIIQSRGLVPWVADKVWRKMNMPVMSSATLIICASLLCVVIFGVRHWRIEGLSSERFWEPTIMEISLKQSIKLWISCKHNWRNAAGINHGDKKTDICICEKLRHLHTRTAANWLHAAGDYKGQRCGSALLQASLPYILCQRCFYCWKFWQGNISHGSAKEFLPAPPSQYDSCSMFTGAMYSSPSAAALFCIADLVKINRDIPWHASNSIANERSHGCKNKQQNSRLFKTHLHAIYTISNLHREALNYLSIYLCMLLL